MDSIAIIMATYNGEKFLAQQLDSICAQTYTKWELFIFDDNSVDRTFEIASAFSSHEDRIKVYRNNENFGVTLNFLNALEKIYDIGDFNYFMFSDQDDIWMPDKIEKTYSRMQEEEKSSEIVLVHTNLKIVDSTGSVVIAESLKEYAHLKNIENNVFCRLLAQPFVFGCTTMMNRPLVEKLFPVPQSIYAHDSWVSLIASALGKVSYICEATIEYRQHSSNASGSVSARSMTNRIKRITSGWKNQILITQKRLIQGEALIRYIDGSVFSGILKEYCFACRKSALNAIHRTVKFKILRQGVIANVLYFITLFFVERVKNG